MHPPRRALRNATRPAPARFGSARAHSRSPRSLHAAVLLLWVCLAACALAPPALALLLPSPDALPAPRQPRDRLLVCNTLADIGSRGEAVLAKQLDAYVAACEAGFEVHVVIVTLSREWGGAQHLFAPSRNLCSRLQADIPVALSVYSSLLATRHREVFASKLNQYDFYFSHEDDMLFKAHHFHYFRHWSHAFQATPLLHPGFVLYEVPTRHVPPASLLRYAPAVTLNDWRADLHLFKWRDHLMAMFHVAYDASYMLTGDQLRHYAARPAWLQSAGLPWDERNVPFQGQFLSKYVHRVVPVAHMWRAIVHHTSNKYVNLHLDQAAAAAAENKSTTQQPMVRRKHGVDISEVMLVLRRCTGLALETPHLSPPFNASTLDIRFRSPQPATAAAPHPCNACLGAGQAAVLRFSVNSPGGMAFSPGNSSPEASVAEVGVECSTSLQQQWWSGCKEDARCQDRDEEFWGQLLEGHTSLDRVRPSEFFKA